jgi:hypothetical protein
LAIFSDLSADMPAKPPKDWKPFRLADGTTRPLPTWADKPLNFAFPPDEALRQGANVRTPKRLKKLARD